MNVPPAAPLPPAYPLPYALSPAEKTWRAAVPPGWTNVDVFTLRPETMWPFIWFVLALRSVMTLGTLTVSLVAANWLGVLGTSLAEKIFFCVVFTFFFVVSQAISSVRFIFATRKDWSAYRLLVADQGLAQFRRNQKPNIIERPQITGILERYDDFQLLLGGGKNLLLPKRIERIDVLRARLRQWHDVMPAQSVWRFIRTLGSSLLLPGAVVATFLLGWTTADIYWLVLYIVACTVLTMIGFSRIIRGVSYRTSDRIYAWLSLIGPLSLLARLAWLIFVAP